MSHTDEPPRAPGATETSETRQPAETPSAGTPSARVPSAETPSTRRNMLPARGRRPLGLERGLMRVIATCGIVGIGVALGAILISSKVEGWITGLVVSIVSVVLSAILWSSREL